MGIISENKSAELLNAVGIHSGNVDSVIKSLLEQINKSPQPEFSGFYFPSSFKGELDRSKYKGRGRPKKNDYERIDTMKILEEISNENKNSI